MRRRDKFLPWELVTLAEYEGDNYWLEPWIEDLFRDIKQKKMTVKEVKAKLSRRESERRGHKDEKLAAWA